MIYLSSFSSIKMIFNTGEHKKVRFFRLTVESFGGIICVCR